MDPQWWYPGALERNDAPGTKVSRHYKIIHLIMRSTSTIAVSPALLFSSSGVTSRGVNTYLEITGVSHAVKRIKIMSVINGACTIAAPISPISMRSSLTNGEVFCIMPVTSAAFVTKELTDMEFVFDAPVFINGRHELRIRNETATGALTTSTTPVQTIVHIICYSE